jgi:hypothetical protein
MRPPLNKEVESMYSPTYFAMRPPETCERHHHNRARILVVSLTGLTCICLLDPCISREHSHPAWQTYRLA